MSDASEVDPSRDRVTVRGPDTWTFLQSLLSQDVEGMADGESRAALMLTPQGKVEVAARVRREGDAAVLETDSGWGAALAAVLTRYRIRTKVEIEAEPPAAAPTAAEERARVEAGLPRMGSELDDSVIPQEAFLDESAVSFTKGCFVGQELVCRIDTRGHVNRYLRRLRPEDATAVLEPGAEIVHAGKVVGKVTSSAPGVALGFVRREVEPPATVVVAGGSVKVLPRG